MGLMVVDFGCGSGFVAADFGFFLCWIVGQWWCGWILYVFHHLPLTFTLSSVPHSCQPKPWVSLCSMQVSGLMICGFDGGGFCCGSGFMAVDFGLFCGGL